VNGLLAGGEICGLRMTPQVLDCAYGYQENYEEANEVEAERRQEDDADEESG